MRKIVVDIVSRHINDWDPEYLLEMGAPDDEYDLEIERIVDDVLVSKNDLEIAESIKYTFEHYFKRKYPFEECHKVAKEICKELKRTTWEVL